MNISVTNLSADIHNLFDFGLLQVHPNTLNIDLHQTLNTIEYTSLEGKKLVRLQTNNSLEKSILKEYNNL